MQAFHLESHLPHLSSSAYIIVSYQDRGYNCIAWAAGRTDVAWWPIDYGRPGGIYWPPGVAEEETVEAFAAAFRTLGFTPCRDGDPDPRYEKVAIYADAGGPTHAARQLSDGRWTSKLGDFEDITHQSLHDLEDGVYGNVAMFLCRRVRTRSPREIIRMSILAAWRRVWGKAKPA
jgi:hypothetical protein